MNWSQRPMAAPFFSRLRRSSQIAAADVAALSALPAEIRVFEAHATIVPEGRRNDHVHVMLDGWASRTKILENGSRQMPALFVAGDVCDLDGLLFVRSDCTTMALTRCTVALLPRDILLTLLDRHRGLRHALGSMLATELSTSTQWTVCLGRRSARERLGHLLCELSVRLHSVGLGNGLGVCTLPLTQEEIADVLGLTAVHVNRTLQGLRSDGLIQLREQRLLINDWAALRRECGFDAAYLHVDGVAAGPPDGRGMSADAHVSLNS